MSLIDWVASFISYRDTSISSENPEAAPPPPSVQMCGARRWKKEKFMLISGSLSNEGPLLRVRVPHHLSFYLKTVNGQLFVWLNSDRRELGV